MLCVFAAYLLWVACCGCFWFVFCLLFVCGLLAYGLVVYSWCTIVNSVVVGFYFVYYFVFLIWDCLSVGIWVWVCVAVIVGVGYVCVLLIWVLVWDLFVLVFMLVFLLMLVILFRLLVDLVFIAGVC